MNAQATYAVYETSSSARVHRIPVQAFPKFWAYVYLVQTSDANILIDSGSGTDPCHDDLLQGLKRAGLQPSDLTHILLTHAHIDHYGGLSKLRPLTTAKIACHELDMQTVSYHEARLALIGRRLASFLTEAGLGLEERDTLLGIYRFTKALYTSVPVDFAYSDVKNHVPALETVHLPGHCPGHVAMRLDDIVFCGDMVVEGVTPHLAPESINPFGGLDHYLNSLARLQNWAQGARLILNGHDDVITDLPARIEATRHNLVRRMSKALVAMEQPLTMAEICEAVYGPMSGYNKLLVIEKSGAYVEYLYEHGIIGIANPAEMEQGKPARYKRLRNVMDSEILPKERNHVLV